MLFCRESRSKLRGYPGPITGDAASPLRLQIPHDSVAQPAEPGEAGQRGRELGRAGGGGAPRAPHPRLRRRGVPTGINLYWREHFTLFCLVLWKPDGYNS